MSVEARPRRPDRSLFPGVVDTVLPNGGVVLGVQAFFDESESNGNFAVAGYLVDKKVAKTMHREWYAVLRRYDVPYFHMVDCVHGRGVFANLSRQERISLQTEMVSLANRNVLWGYAVIISHDDFATLVQPVLKAPDIYSFCVRMALIGVGIWGRWHDFKGKVAFFFEKGQAHERAANKMLGELSAVEEGKLPYRIGSHSFIGKEDAAALQAADIFAYQSLKFLKNKREGRDKPRADFQALLRNQQHTFMHCTPENLANLEVQFANWNWSGDVTE